MKIKAKVESYTTKEIDVEFPLYLKHGDVFDSGGWYDTYTRYEANGTHISFTEHDDHWEFKHDYDPARVDLKANLGYHLIKNDHRSTKEEFYAKLDELIAALQAVPR